MPNQQQDAPLEYYKAKFRALDPEEASKRTGLPFDPHRSRYKLTILGQTLHVNWPNSEITPEDLENCPKILYNFGMRLLALQFLLAGAYAPHCGEFMAYRELPWGEVYDANFRGRCIRRFAHTFGYDPGKFIKAAEMLGGVRLELGDVSYDLPFLGGVICRLILWTPDDEFPPSAQILFSDNTQLSFNAEALAGVGDVVIGALKESSNR